MTMNKSGYYFLLFFFPPSLSLTSLPRCLRSLTSLLPFLSFLPSLSPPPLLVYMVDVWISEMLKRQDGQEKVCDN